MRPKRRISAAYRPAKPPPEPRGADLALLAGLVARASSPSPALLSALAESAHEAGRSLGALARRTRSSRQAAARWVAGCPVRTYRARQGLADYAAVLAAGPEAPHMVRATDPRPPDLADLFTERLARRLGFPLPKPQHGRLPYAVLPGPMGAADVEQAAQAEFAVELKASRSPSSGIAVAVVAARARVLDALGFSSVAIGALLGRHHSTILWHLGRSEQRRAGR